MQIFKEKRLIFQERGKPGGAGGAERIESGPSDREKTENKSEASLNNIGGDLADSAVVESTGPKKILTLEIMKDMGYDYVSPFDSGVAIAGKAGVYFVINEEGKRVGKGSYDDAQLPQEGRIGVKVGSKWHFIDKDDKDLKFGEFDEVYPFYGGIAGVRIGRYWKFIKKDGSRLNDNSYDAVEDFDMSDGTVNGRRNGRWITINRSGKEIKISEPVQVNLDNETTAPNKVSPKNSPKIILD